MNHDHHGISLKVFQILLVTSATLVVTGALLVVTKKLLDFNSFFVTTSKAPVTTSVALVSTCFLFSHSAHSGPAWYAALSLTIWAARLGSPGRRVVVLVLEPNGLSAAPDSAQRERGLGSMESVVRPGAASK